MSDSGPKRTRTHRRHKAGGALVIAVAAVSLAVGAAAPAQDLEGELDTKQSELDQAQAKRGVLSTEIERYSSKISQLEGEVATLRNREALVQQELEEKQAQLDRERHHLQVLRERLDKSERPDALTVILEADGFSDLIERYEYLNQIEQRDSDIVDRVRDLRNATKDTVQRIRAARNEIAAKKRELTRTRVALEAREAELSAARANRQDTLSEIDSNIKRLEGDIGDLEGQIQQQLQASAAPTLPAGPVRGGSSGMIWPVDGPISSPFGMRWGRLHAGIDISVPAGTPIRAAKDGTVALAAPTGGYGNYTCIDHGGGLSTCYAHQSRFAGTP